MLTQFQSSTGGVSQFQRGTGHVSRLLVAMAILAHESWLGLHDVDFLEFAFLALFLQLNSVAYGLAVATKRSARERVGRDNW
jgi:hypothetical protein